MQFRNLRRGTLFVLISPNNTMPILRKVDHATALKVEGVDPDRKFITRGSALTIPAHALVQQIAKKSILG